MTQTKEPQYNSVVDSYIDNGPVKLGIHTSHFWRTDPKRLGFMLARYKFVAKMFSGMNDILEVGCGDGFGAELVLQEVKNILAVDFDPAFIEHCINERIHQNLVFAVADLTEGPVLPERDGVYALDVFEHITKDKEAVFMKNVVKSIHKKGTCIIGMPSIESQIYASEWSKEGHINCKSGPELKKFMENYFYNVFLFGMNDETLHTGFHPMAHYLFALCAYPK